MKGMIFLKTIGQAADLDMASRLIKNRLGCHFW